MVSASTGLKLLGVAIAAATFLGLGGASGIGKKLGTTLNRGFTDFSESFTQGLTGLFDNIGGPTINPAAATVNSPNTPADDFVIKFGTPAPNPDAVKAGGTIAESFRTALENKTISGDFASKFSFRPPPVVGSGKLDVSKTFRFISEGSQTRFKQESSAPYGGFRSKSAQTAALQAAIARSAAANPQFFG